MPKRDFVPSFTWLCLWQHPGGLGHSHSGVWNEAATGTDVLPEQGCLQPLGSRSMERAVPH